MTEGLSCIIILGDTGYISKKPYDKMKEQGICLMSFNRSNSKND